MAGETLTLRRINRATLARQMLLKRESIGAAEAIEKLVGMQAQLAQAPYVGLWTRLEDFKREDLAGPIEAHTVIKTTHMRATLHLATAKDYMRLRGELQPVLSAAAEAITKGRGEAFDQAQVLAAARTFIAEEPRSFAQISAMLTERFPDTDVGAMRYTVRTHIPMVQVPTNDGWSYPGNPKFTLADEWIGKQVPTEPTEEGLRALILRYLAAFGPATAADMQTRSGLAKLKDAVAKLKPELVVYKDENRKELLDVPGAPMPDEDTPAPERFLPEFDNILLSHTKRTRIVADEYKSQVYLPALRVRATFLVDGFVRGGWRVERSKKEATLVVEPFASLTKQNRNALEAEAERLVRFMEPDAKEYGVRFSS